MKSKKNCRICNGKLSLIINFGKISLVGNFRKKKKNLKRYKISLNFCTNCFHIQIREIINPNKIFKNYLWETGVSKSNLFIIDKLINDLKRLKLNKSSKVLEIASNDGTLINRIKDKIKCYVVGVDPAKNLNKINLEKFTIRISAFFNLKNSISLKKKYSTFNYIIARNVIAHVENPNEIFSGAEKILSDNGIFVVEVPHLLNIFKYNQYDNIFHEHIGFHSLKSIIDLCKKNNLKIFDVKLIDSQGGSIRCFICKKSLKQKISRKVSKVLKIEKNANLFKKRNIINFKYKIKDHSKKMNHLIKNLKIKNKNISVYGASGKGLALLQICKINEKLIDYVFDKSKLKQNCYTPGTNIKILNPRFILTKKVDYLLILSWNIKNEIINQENLFYQKGGKFVVPFPKPKILQ